MKATELKIGQNYKIGTTTYTYRGLVDERKGMTKSNKLHFWVRESNETSPVINDVAIRIDDFNKNFSNETTEIN